MTEVIEKITLPNYKDVQTASMPRRAKILSAGADASGRPFMFIRSLVTDERVERAFRIFRTGEPIETIPCKALRFVGSFQIDEAGNARHLFEIADY